MARLLFIAVATILELSIISAIVYGPGCPDVISRSDWGAAAPKKTPSRLRNPVQYVFIHHTDTPECHSLSQCMARVRSIQNYHQNGRNYNDIGYSFLFGPDGNIYEGRGFDIVGAHTLGYNSKGYGFSAIGQYDKYLPNISIQNNMKALINCGVRLGKISSSYVLRAHREMKSTQCPGTAFYNLIKGWPHH